MTEIGCASVTKRSDLSIGTLGHPHTCARPCKYNSKSHGCSRGSECIRCHLCTWPPPQRTFKTPKPIHPQHNVSTCSSGQLCSLGISTVDGSFTQVMASVTLMEFDDHLSVSSSCVASSEVLSKLRIRLLDDGFTAAPNSEELIEIVRAMDHQYLEILRRCRMPPGISSSHIAAASIVQLRQICPVGSIVLGLYKARMRTLRPDNALSLHKDDVLLTEDEVRLALFSSESYDIIRDPSFLDHYCNVVTDARIKYPLLDLPSSIDVHQKLSVSGDVRSIINQIIESIQRYNDTLENSSDALMFDNVNVWVPRDSKQLVLLPQALSNEIGYPLSSEDRVKLLDCFSRKFKTFGRGVALIFFGQSVLHQALVGPEFDCGTGSLEGRYLVLMPRKYVCSGSLRNHVATML